MEIILDGKIGVVEVASIIISFIALRIALKNRRNSLRDIVYERQLNVLQELFNRIAEVEDRMGDWEVERRLLNNPTELRKIETRLFSATEEFQIHMHKVEILIPRQLHKKFSNLLDHINMIKCEVSDKTTDSIDVDELAEEVFALKNDVRRFMGLDNLARENNKLASK